MGDFRPRSGFLVEWPVRSRARAWLVLVAWSVAFASCGAAAESLEGRVVRVRDGDSLVVLVDRRTVEVRLAEVDAPESGQPWGKRAKRELSDLAFGKTIEAEVIDVDRYGRKVARVFADGVDVPAEMVRRGAAWVYTKYAKREELAGIESTARDARAGLWSLPEKDRVPPWEWREQHREASRTGSPPDPGKRPPTPRLPSAPAAP